MDSYNIIASHQVTNKIIERGVEAPIALNVFVSMILWGPWWRTNSRLIQFERFAQWKVR